MTVVTCEIVNDSRREEIVVTSPKGGRIFVSYYNLPMQFARFMEQPHAKIVKTDLTRDDMLDLYARRTQR